MDASLAEILAAAALGFAGGMVGGLIGVGGGVLFVPALALFLDQSQLEANSTSLLAIVFVAALGAWRQHGYGNVRLRDGLLVGRAVAARRRRGRACCPTTSPSASLELSFAALRGLDRDPARRSAPCGRPRRPRAMDDPMPVGRGDRDPALRGRDAREPLLGARAASTRT